MVEENSSNDKQQEGKESPLTVSSKPSDTAPPSGSDKQVQAVGTQKHDSGGNTGAEQSRQQTNTTESELVKELKPFERKTLSLGIFAVAGAFVTAFLFLVQIKVTSHQNQILSSQAISGVAQSITEERNTQTQLDLLRQQVSSTGIEAQAANKAADAAKSSADISQRQVRAYVSLESETAIQYAKNQGIILSNFAFRNPGQSPALHVSIEMRWYFEKVSPDPQYQACNKATRLKRSDLGTSGSNSVITPNGISIMTFYPSDDGTEFKRLTTTVEPDTACAYGSEFYEDIFGGCHETEFCVHWLNGGLWAQCSTLNVMYDYPKKNGKCQWK